MGKKAMAAQTLAIIVFGVLILIAVLILIIGPGGQAGNSAWDTAKHSLSGLFG